MLAILPATPSILKSLADLDLPACPIPCLLAVGIGGWTILITYAMRTSPDRRVPRALLLALIGAAYAAMLRFLIQFPAERFHLLEYGILGGLAWRATDIRAGGLRRGLRSAAFVATVSLLDEVLQGVIQGRYYDNQDLVVNFLAGILGGAAFLLAGLSPSNAGAPGRGTPEGGPVTDTLAAFVLAGVVLGAAFLARPPFDEQRLAGAWTRVGECGIMEEITLDGKGALEWQDQEGNRARGRYAIAGNRLDGPRLDLVCDSAENKSPCGLQPGFSARVYITLQEGRFFFDDAPDAPFSLMSPPWKERNGTGQP
jgi:hypothetical protein